MEWDKLKSCFNRLYAKKAPDTGATGQSIEAYQTELLKLYDHWAGVNTDISLHGDSMCKSPKRV